jgi:hypothetical protein
MAKHWIQSAIKHPGRCAHMGSAACPAGSPQYNLAKRFKAGGDLHHAGKKKKKEKGFSMPKKDAHGFY